MVVNVWFWNLLLIVWVLSAARSWNWPVGKMSGPPSLKLVVENKYLNCHAFTQWIDPLVKHDNMLFVMVSYQFTGTGNQLPAPPTIQSQTPYDLQNTPSQQTFGPSGPSTSGTSGAPRPVPPSQPQGQPQVQPVPVSQVQASQGKLLLSFTVSCDF